MSKIDWSKAPEGAQWHSKGEFFDYWYKIVEGDLLFWSLGRWNKSTFKSIEDVACNSIILTPRPDFQPFISIEDAQPAPDMVNHPPHYQSDNGIECIDAIRAALGRDGFIAYCIGNSMKYQWREKADKLEDMRKAAWYLNRAIEEQSK
ncbi:MAG: DUF3310 domain-containing protein [Aeromonadaceae bacterium]